MSSHLALIIWDWWEGHCSICSVGHCFDNSSVCFLQDKAVFTCFKSFTFKNFLSSESNGCVTCWGVFVCKYKIFCFFWGSCFQFSCAYFFNRYFNFLNGLIVSDSCFRSSNFWDSVLVSSYLALIIWDWWEGHCSICSVGYCFDNSSVCFLQDKAVFTCFKSFTFKNFFRTKSNGCVTCWGVDIIEGCAISCTITAVFNSCMQFTLTIIGYSYFSCDSLSIVGDTILRCASFYFLDGVSVSTCFIKCQLWEFNFSVSTILRFFNVTNLVCQCKFEHVSFEIAIT